MIFRGLDIPYGKISEKTKIDKQYLFNLFLDNYKGEISIIEDTNQDRIELMEVVTLQPRIAIKKAINYPLNWYGGHAKLCEEAVERYYNGNLYLVIDLWISKEIRKAFDKYKKIILADAQGAIIKYINYSWADKQILDYWWITISQRDYDFSQLESCTTYFVEAKYKVGIIEE